MLFTTTNLVRLYKYKFVNKLAYRMILLLGADIPTDVKLGRNVRFPHNSIGTVLHNNTYIGNNVKIYQNVTFGRADIWKSAVESKFEKFVVEDGAVICAGAKIIGKKGVLTIGKNSIIAANAVLLNSTGENEVWGGIPAKLIGLRDRE